MLQLISRLSGHGVLSLVDSNQLMHGLFTLVISDDSGQRACGCCLAQIYLLLTLRRVAASWSSCCEDQLQHAHVFSEVSNGNMNMHGRSTTSLRRRWPQMHYRIVMVDAGNSLCKMRPWHEPHRA